MNKTKKNAKAEEAQRILIPAALSDPREGLTSQQVQERLAGGWGNVSVDTTSRTTKDIILGNLCTYFNLVFLVLTVLLCLVGAFKNLTFLPVIIANMLIGTIQELRAKKTLEKMNMLAAPKAAVVRDGCVQTIDAEGLVRDDIVRFSAGNQICADAEVVSGDVTVNESLLTGESDEISKASGDKLISGSFVVSGECCARLTAVGADSYISRLEIEAKEMKTQEQSEMMRSLNKLMLFIGIILIPIGIALFAQAHYLNEETIQRSVTSAIAAVIGMIPEGLYLLTSIALAASSIRLANRHVLLHDMKSIETLARVDVLCVDKTGTITENTMEVKELIPLNKKDLDELTALMGDFAEAMSSDNITMEAVKAYFTAGSGRLPRHVTPFSSTVKYSAVTFEEGTFVLGAPEFVLRDDYEKYKNQILDFTQKGFRVLVIGQCAGTADGRPLHDPVTPFGLVLLYNPIRKTAPETFAYFAEQGVAIKVISGDNPSTVSEAAKEACIEGAEHYVDATSLKTEEQIRDAMERYTVFGRVTPEQKRTFVRVLKDMGHTVAMTGDGVNDVLAMKDADCSVAMASGSEAAAQASQLVLLDSDFACMPQVVLEGRRVVNNIERSASLFLVKNTFSLLLSLFSLISTMTYPLEPSQVSLVSMFTIGIPGFFISLQPNKERIKGHFLPNVFLRALPAGVVDMISVGSLAIFGATFGVDTLDISTAATLLFAIVGFLILYRIIHPSNALQWAVWLGSMAGFVLCAILLRDLYGIYAMSVQCVMLLVVFSFATEALFRYMFIWMDHLRNFFSHFGRAWKATKETKEE